MKSLDGDLIVSIDSQDPWKPIVNLKNFKVAALGIAKTVTELLHLTVWSAHDTVPAHIQLVKLYLELDARLTIQDLVHLFSLRV